MQHIQRSGAVRHDNSPSCSVWEYDSIDSIDAADCVVNGRYPESGFARNEASNLSIRVISGVGRLATKQADAELVPGDAVLIPSGEPYYFKGDNLAFFMAASPAWSLDQYQEVD